DAEGNITINGAGEIAVCDIGASVTLTADYLKTGATTSYEVLEIPYEPPFPFTGTSGSIELNVDDQWSGIIDLGFDFCFFNEQYSHALINDNGAVTFSISQYGGLYTQIGRASCRERV